MDGAAGFIAAGKVSGAAHLRGNSGPRVGSVLERSRQDLIDICDVLRDVLEPAGLGLAGEARRLLEKQVCRIAVIGQIKAGKSSFINALTQCPGLLPTDINPSTTAVTNLHFNQSSPTGQNAVFSFLSAQDWESLADGSGRLRELTHRLVPGFEPGLLRHNVAAMRQRAERRLGAQFSALLGQSHAYADVSRDVLARYVCAGEPGAAGDVGLYSDITRSADIYLSGGPFDFPVTVTDTPGTNDPLLMRDEITRSCLDKADGYILVLTAHQPLSDSDVSLLRILRGLHKERIVAYVNRLDELGDSERDGREIMAYVRQRLAVEFPGFEIPLIAGSAKWGGGLSSAALSIRTNDAATSQQVAQGGERRASAGPSAHASGLIETTSELNRLLASSHSAYVMRQICGCFAEMTRASESSVRQELDTLRSTHMQAQMTAERVSAELEQLGREQQNLASTQQTIETSAKQFHDQLKAIMGRDLDALREHLHAAVDRHATEEREALVAVLRNRKAPAVWHCDVAPLRRELAQLFIDSFRRSESQLVSFSSQVTNGLRRLAEALVTGAVAPAQSEPRHDAIPPPNPTALGGTLALDLGESWWSMLWRSRPTPEERGELVEQLVRDEFDRVVDEMLAAYHDVLDAYITTTTRWSFAVCSNVVQALSRRQEQLAAHYNSVLCGVTGTADSDTMNAQSIAIEALEHRLAITEKTAGRLAVIAKSIGA